MGGVFLSKNLKAPEVIFGGWVWRKRRSAVESFVGEMASESNKYLLAANVQTKEVEAKRLFAHRILWSSGGAEKESSKRSAFSALSFSQSVVDLRESCRFDSMVVGASVRTEMGLKKNVGQ